MAPSTQAEERPVFPSEGEYRYRLDGSIRILFFWIGRDNIGTARVRWRDQRGTDTISIHIGSDPGRAPRAVNEWGYIRERVAGGTATVFGIRSLGDSESLSDADAMTAAGAGERAYGVLCSTASPTGYHVATTRVRPEEVLTYRQVRALLDVIDRAATWTVSHERPPDTVHGFLVALRGTLKAGVIAARQGSTPTMPAATYVYRGGVFDLRLRDIRPVEADVAARAAIEGLLRSRMVIRNRRTRDETNFTVTYGTREPLAGVPVHVTFQPRWWLRVELWLDDSADAPPDPGADPDLEERIASICRVAESAPGRSNRAPTAHSTGP